MATTRLPRSLEGGEMPVEADARFLNIDLLLVGRFDREPLMAALERGVFVLHDDATFEEEDCLILEVLEPGLDLARTITRLVNWAQGFPPAARRSWAAASRRVFDIGIQSGLKPHDSHWAISPEHIKALAKLRSEVALTVYGAEWVEKPPSPTSRAKRRTPGPDRRRGGRAKRTRRATPRGGREA